MADKRGMVAGTASDGSGPMPEGANNMQNMMESLSLGPVNQQHGLHSVDPSPEVLAESVKDNQCQVLVSNIPDGTSKDHLLHYLEGLSGLDLDVETVNRGSKPGVAIVTFQKPVDMTQLQNACTHHQLSGRVLHVGPVDTRGAVIVCNFDPRSSDACFLYCFRNERRNGGEKGAEIIYRDPSNRFLTVYFSCKEVADRVADRAAQGELKLDDSVLQIKSFDHNLMEVEDALLDVTTTRNNATEWSSVGSGAGTVFPSSNTGAEYVEIKPEEIEIPVKGIHPACLVMIDAFSRSITNLFPLVNVTTKDDIVMLKGEESHVKMVQASLNNFLLVRRETEFLADVPDHFWDKMFEELEDEIDGGDYYLSTGFSGEEELHVQTKKGQTYSVFDFFKSLAMGYDVPIDHSMAKELLYTPAWKEFLTDFEYAGEVQVKEKPQEGKVTLFGSTKIIKQAADAVQRFLNNSDTTKYLTISSKQKDFLNLYCQGVLDKLQFGVVGDTVEVEFADGVCVIKGCHRAVRQAFEELQEICTSLRCYRAVFAYPGLMKIVQMSDWEEMIKKVSQDKSCIISEFPDRSIKDMSSVWGTRAATVVHSYRMSLDCHVHVVDGDVLAMAVDAVVVFSGQNGVTQTLTATQAHRTPHEHGGSSEMFSFDGDEACDMRLSDLKVTQAGALPCKVLIHINPQTYQLRGSADDQVKGLKSLVTDILHTAETHHLSSLAIPILCVDVSGPHSCKLPINIAVSAIIEATRNYTLSMTSAVCDDSDRCSTRSLQNICLCSGRAACVRALEDMLNDDFKLPFSSPDSYELLASSQNDGSLSEGPRRPLTRENIQVIMGDVVNMKTDVVVVPLDPDLDMHKSKVTRSLMERGGRRVVDAVLYGESYGWLSRGEKVQDQEEKFAESRFLVGTGGLLHASLIFYLYLPPWGPQVREILTKLLLRSLEEASNRKKKVVAFTALGAGKLTGYPSEFVARTMLSVISGYMEQASCQLERVKIVILPSDEHCWRVFSNEYAEWLNSRVYPGEVYSQGISHHKKQDCGSERQTASYADAVRQSPHSHSQDLLYGNPYDGRRGQRACSHSFKIGMVKLTVKIGDIIQEKCDITVNSTNMEIDLSRGAVSKALKERFGKDFEAECKKKDRRKKMKDKGFCLTNVPHVNGKKVLHIDWDRFHKTPLSEIISKCLSVARDAKTRKWIPQTVGFPLLGTGAKTHKPEDMAESLVKVCQEQLQKKKEVKDVRLVLFNSQLYNHLVSVIEKLVLKPNHSQMKKPVKRSATANKENIRAGQPSPNKQPTRPALEQKPSRNISRRTSLEAYSLFLYSDNEDKLEEAKMEIDSWIQTLLDFNNPKPPPSTRDTQRPGSGGYLDGAGRRGERGASAATDDKSLSYSLGSLMCVSH